MHKVSFLAALILASSCASASALLRADDSGGSAGGEVHYLVDLSAPQTQHVDVSMTFPTEGLGACEVMLPTWRPGRYTILDPASTVYRVRASSGDGEELAIRKTAKSAWRIQTAGAETVSVSYTLYANSIGDRTRHVDPTHAFLSGSAVFFYSPRLRSAPVRLEIHAPEGWDVATGLEKAPGEEHVLVARDYDVLVDSPLEIGLHDRIDFEVAGKPHEIVIWPPGIEHDSEQMVGDFTKIIEEQLAIFGRLPFERYVFLIHARGGGGTEHLNSTIVQTSRGAIEASKGNGSRYKSLLGTISHEFFHTWNVKQLRPAGMHPYDYQSENYTDLLWVSEGTTSYFGPLTLVRAEISDVKRYIDRIGSAGNSLRSSLGARVTSVAEASWDSWISSFNANTPNTRVDYYGKGAQTSLCLDMELRARTENRESLDTLMRTMFERFPLSGPGFTSEDMLSVLHELSGSSFEEFFSRYVFGTEELPYEETLTTVGLEFYFDANRKQGRDEDGSASDDEEEPRDPPQIPQRAYLGMGLSGGGSGSTVRSLLSDGPAYASGLLVGDEILTLNGKRLRAGDLDDLLEDLEPGDSVKIHYLRDDDLRVLDIELAGIPDGKWKVRRVEDPTEAQKAAYAGWIGHDWPGGKTDAKGGEAE